MSYTGSSFPADLLVGEPSLERLALRERGSFSRVLITFCIGVAATPTWRSYGDAATQIIASSYPQLSWLAPEATIAQTRPATIGAPVTSPDRLQAMSFDLAALRQRVDQIAAGQDGIAHHVSTKLQAAEQDILAKISAPSPQLAVPPTRKPAPQPLQLAPSC